jgi:hypothetical protein
MKTLCVCVKRVEMSWYESNLSSNCVCVCVGGGIYRVMGTQFEIFRIFPGFFRAQTVKNK